MGEYLVGTIIVLMFSGGTALEQFATRRASSVSTRWRSACRRLHRQRGTAVEDIKLDQIQIGDHIIVLPHEICPADGAVIEGHGVMDESYLTGEPFEISKTPGAKVLSGAINGDMALTIEAENLAVDSRYAKIMQVMEQTSRSGRNSAALETASVLGTHHWLWELLG